jgi:hypothetical protein
MGRSQKHMPAVGLPLKPIIHIVMRDLPNCLQSDATSATPPICTINQAFVRIQGIQISEAIQSQIMSLLNNGGGYAYHIYTYESHPLELWTASDPAVGPQTWRIQIKNIKNFVDTLFFRVRQSSKVRTAAVTPDKNRWVTLVPSQWWLEDGSSEVTKRYDGLGPVGSENLEHNRHALINQNTLAHPKAPVGLGIPHIFLTEQGYDESTTSDEVGDNTVGGRLFSKYNNLQLCVYWEQNHPQLTSGTVYELDIEGQIHNTMSFVKGDWRRFII